MLPKVSEPWTYISIEFKQMYYGTLLFIFTIFIIICIFSSLKTFVVVQIKEHSNLFMIVNKIVNNINFSLIKWLFAFYTEFNWCKSEEATPVLKMSSQNQVLNSSAEEQCWRLYKNSNIGIFRIRRTWNLSAEERYHNKEIKQGFV